MPTKQMQKIKREAHEMTVRLMLKVLVARSIVPAESLRELLLHELAPVLDRLRVWDSALGSPYETAVQEEIDFIFGPPAGATSRA